MKPTPKQISYAAVLLEKKGYGSRFMNAKFKELGASMQERSGTVQAWLENMTRGEISALIAKLLG